MSYNEHNDRVNGWQEYRRLVLSEIGRAIDGVDKVDRKIDDRTDKLQSEIIAMHKDLQKFNALTDKKFEKIERDLAVQKAKASIYGGLAGLLIASIPQLISYFL